MASADFQALQIKISFAISRGGRLGSNLFCFLQLQQGRRQWQALAFVSFALGRFAGTFEHSAGLNLTLAQWARRQCHDASHLAGYTPDNSASSEHKRR